MIIEFEDRTHTYFVDGDIASISVTELLAKHGLSTNYSGVSKGVLRERAEAGKVIHKDCENVLNTAKYEPTTSEGKRFAGWVGENMECGVGEQMLAFNYNGMIICGTADFMGFNKSGELIIGDHKATSKLNKEYVTWQVNLLDYMARQLRGEKINGVPMNWAGASKMYAMQYKKGGKMQVHILDKIPDIEIERLIECEYKGEKYNRRQLYLDNEFKSKFLQAEQELIRIEQDYKRAEQRAKDLRALLVEMFEKQGVVSWESDNIVARYIPKMSKITTDTKKLKEVYPQVYTDCQKMTNVKSYVKISVKNNE